MALVVMLVTFCANCGGATKSILATPPRCELNKAAAEIDNEGRSAGARLGWREIATDNFDQGCLAWNWNVYNGPGTSGVGNRRPEAVQVVDGELRLLGQGQTIGGVAEVENRLYGKWEVRARSESRLGYSQVVLLWPESDNWPIDGEVDFSEVTEANRQSNNFTVHYGEDDQQVGTRVAGDFTQWHNYAVDWSPDHLAMFVDGEEIFRTTDPAAIPRTPMHLALQQDVGPLTNWLPAPDPNVTDVLTMRVDWVRIYE